LLSATYEQAFELVRDFVSRQGPGTEAKVFGLNSARFYDL
jgi:hypothetical protein